MVCRRITVAAAITTGSMLACGIEPCAARPNNRICRLSATEVMAPAPGNGSRRAHHDMLAEDDSRFEEAFEKAIVPIS